MSELKGQSCPMCHQKTLSLNEEEKEVPYFGRLLLFSMTCSSCKYHKADVESLEHRDPSRHTLEISSEDDLKIRVVKSSTATIKIPHVITVTPNTGSNGFVTNVEGVLNRIVHAIEIARDSEEDTDAKKKAKNLLKKLQKVMWGRERIKLILEDPSGNSAIISDKAEVKKIKE